MAYQCDKDHLLGKGGYAHVYWVDDKTAVKRVLHGGDDETRRETLFEIELMLKFKRQVSPMQGNCKAMNAILKMVWCRLDTVSNNISTIFFACVTLVTLYYTRLYLPYTLCKSCWWQNDWSWAETHSACGWLQGRRYLHIHRDGKGKVQHAPDDFWWTIHRYLQHSIIYILIHIIRF